MKTTWAHFKVTIFILCLLIAALSMIIFDFKSQLDQTSSGRAAELLQIESENATNSFEVILDSQFNHLKLLSHSLSAFDENQVMEIQELLEFSAKETNASRVAIVNPQGMSLSSDHSLLDISDRDYFKRAMQGELRVVESLISRIDGEQALILAVPLFHEDEVVGVLRASYSLETMNQIFRENKINNDYYTYIFKHDGRIIASNNPHLTSKTTVFDLTLQFDQEQVLLMMYNLENHESGTLEGVYANQQRFLYYQPSFEDDWYVLSSLPSAYLVENTRSIRNNMISFTIKLIACFACLAFYIFYSIKKQNNLLASSYYALKLSEERYRILTERTNTIIFEYNYDTKQFICSPNFYDQFERDPEIFLKFDENCTSMVHEDDLMLIEKINREIQSGDVEIQEELRLLRSDGNYAWYMIRISIIKDTHEKIRRIVGDMHNIDCQRKETEALKIIANHDSLTSLYNKKTTHSRIDDYLDDHKGSRNALMIIDIDNFKGINDHLGHLFGDSVLSDIAGKIKGLFRTSDIIGRIGGDEFVVFLNNVSKDIVEHKANEVCDVFKRSYTGNNHDYKISGSIGIAMSPDDGKTFIELYENADAALYITKKNGKDGYAFYGHSELAHSQGNFSAHDLEEWSLFTHETMNASFEFFVFSMLYNADDLMDSIQLVLNLLAEQFDFDDIHLIMEGEQTPAHLVYQLNKSEECRAFVSSLIRHINSNKHFYDSFDQQGLSFCVDTTSSNDYAVKLYREASFTSYLQIAYKSGDMIRGFIGFAIKDSERAWTKKEIESLLLISKIMGVFLMKDDLNQQLRTKSKDDTTL